MKGIEKYIEQAFGKGVEPQYSELLYEPSQLGPAGEQFVQREWGNQGAKVILVHSLFLQTPAVAGARQLLDRFNRIVFQFTSITEISGYYDLPYVIRGSEMFFTLNLGTCNFTIGYQYLMEPERP